jgi:thymidylate kinase
MQVEFVGLPGCGKSTLASALEKRLAAEGYRAQGLRNAAKAAIAAAQDKIGFLRRRGERISLYGCFVFAHKNPELFEWMFRMSHKDFVALSWGMEALSQIGILQEHGDPELIVLNDEGFLQRLSWNFIGLEDGPEVAEISALLPDDFITIHLTLPQDLAYARTKDRKKGIPSGLKAKTDAETLAKLARYGTMLDRFVEARRARGCPVFKVDTEQDIDLIVDEVIAHLRPFLPVAKPAKQKRKAKL